MKCVIPEISYHNRDPVLSCDFQLSGGGAVSRLATAGSDTHVVIWSVEVSSTGEVSLDCLSDLTRHQRAVNIVRWSPDGALLASGDDESIIIVWQLRVGETGGGLFDEDTDNKENWVVYKMIRFHLDDVYDLSWSPCSQFLLSGSVDNAAIITNVHKNSKVAHFAESRGYVQGVSWNSVHSLVSSLSSDRVCRTYNVNTKKVVAKQYKANLQMDSAPQKKKKKVKGEALTQAEPVEKKTDVESEDTKVDNKEKEEEKRADEEEGEKETEGKVENKEMRLFHDETFKGFFRRLSWSPDGELLIAPSGVLETAESSKVQHCSWVFTMVDLSKPVICLPSKDKYTTVVRFSPRLYKLRKVKGGGKSEAGEPGECWAGGRSVVALPYRMIYAVATQNAILFYDTQQANPFGRVSNVHYTGLTDLSWSPCGNILIASSSDGFCSIVTFNPGELGELQETEKKEETTPVNKKQEQHHQKEEKMETDGDLKLELEETQPQPELLPVSQETPVVTLASSTDGKKRAPLVTLISGAANVVQAGGATPEKPKGRRIELITLSSPKTKP